MKSCFLYKITNVINNKCYVGISFYPEQRWYYHKYNRSKKTISIVQLAIDKYGVDSFSFEVLCEGSRDYIRELERKAIILFDSINFGYNIHPGGEGNTGFSIKKRYDDKPHYVAGFWFPNQRTALSKIPIAKHTLYKYLKEGTAGEVYHKPPKHNTSVGTPIYIGGFWFPCITFASLSLVVKIPTLRKRVYDGFIEQQGNPETCGKDHPTTGRTGALCPNSKPVIVMGQRYDSMTLAHKFSDYSENIIRKRIKENHPDFSFESK